MLVGLLVAGAAPRLGHASDPEPAMRLIAPSRSAAAADFTLPGVPGRAPVRLADTRGQVVLLSFWATWCPACRAELPTIQRLHARLKDRGFTVVAVSVDAGDAAGVASFAAAQALAFPVALDPRMTVAARYGVRALPSTFLLDRQGRIRARAVGPREWDTPAARTVIEALLAPTGRGIEPDDDGPVAPPRGPGSQDETAPRGTTPAARRESPPSPGASEGR